MEHRNNKPLNNNNTEQEELKHLKRKNKRQNAFLLLTALQLGAMTIAYYLGRSHK